MESKSKEAPVDIISRLKKSLKVLEESGLSLQQLAEMALNEGKPTAEMLISEKKGNSGSYRRLRIQVTAKKGCRRTASTGRHRWF